MWSRTGGHEFFHALVKYRIDQIEFRGMPAEQFDALRVFVATPAERAAHDSGMTLGQLMGRHRDDEALEVVHPLTGGRHAVLDVDKQLEEGRITFTVNPEPSPG